MKEADKKNDHYRLGVIHCGMGRPRYKWVDKHNQEDYDRGYNDAERGDFVNDLTDEKIELKHRDLDAWLHKFQVKNPKKF